MTWVVLATAPDQLIAEMWQDVLRDNGVPAFIRPGDISSFLGITGYPCRIMIDEEYVDAGRRLLRDEFGLELE